ncbi:hypothetical protein Golob_019623 [Gossypium lobatum]|uniref:ubiquitinyl hydrolase 1 n=1 Tax=Gossypium lobatum TaxID=34289 RepID=A0A7J8L855_9ROSI|nr:hypothetical protein [Gossypium lobatum]
MRLVRAMQRLFRDEVNVLGWKKSFSQGIGVTVPKARTRDKPMNEHLECSRSSENKGVKDDPLVENLRNDRKGTSSDAIAEAEKVNILAALGSCDMMNDSGEKVTSETEGLSSDPSPIGSRSSHPLPPPVPPPKPSSEKLNSRRFASGSLNPVRAGSSRRAVAWPIVSTRTSPSESWPSSPRSHGENEGYNSADEQSPCFVSSYGDAVSLVFLLKKFDLKLMLGVFFLNVRLTSAGLLYLIQERERQFEFDIRLAKGLEVKRMLEDGNCVFRAVADQVYRDFEAYHLVHQMCIDYMVYGSNVEIQDLSEMYNRPIHIYSYSIEVRTMLYCFEISHFVTLNLQSWRRGGSTLIWSLLRRKSSEWAEYLGNDKFKMHVERASTAEPSSSGATSVSESSKVEGSKEQVLSGWMELVLSMEFSYLQAIEAYSILGDDVESMVCYLLETGSSSRREGKATEPSNERMQTQRQATFV